MHTDTHIYIQNCYICDIVISESNKNRNCKFTKSSDNLHTNVVYIRNRE